MKRAQQSFPTILVISCLLLLCLGFYEVASSGVIQLPQTGQTTCYDTSGTYIPCAGTGQDGD